MFPALCQSCPTLSLGLLPKPARHIPAFEKFPVETLFGHIAESTTALASQGQAFICPFFDRPLQPEIGTEGASAADRNNY